MKARDYLPYLDFRKARIAPDMEHVLRVNGDRLQMSATATPREREACGFWVTLHSTHCNNCLEPMKIYCRPVMTTPATQDDDPAWHWAEVEFGPMATTCSCERPKKGGIPQPVPHVKDFRITRQQILSLDGGERPAGEQPSGGKDYAAAAEHLQEYTNDEVPF